MDFVFDTYAIIEIMRGNKKYLEYLNSIAIINAFIFSELSYTLIRNGYPDADGLLKKYEKFITSISPSLIIEAMRFRYKNRKKNLSIPDCISYLQAKSLGIKFLTGDKEFEGLDNVEFVRK